MTKGLCKAAYPRILKPRTLFSVRGFLRRGKIPLKIRRILGTIKKTRAPKGNTGHKQPIPQILSTLAGCDNHYSKRPTWSRTRAACGPAWPCSMRGLPCHSRCRLCGGLLPRHFTLTLAGGILSVALSVQRGYGPAVPPFQAAHCLVESGSSSPAAGTGPGRLSGLFVNLKNFTKCRAQLKAAE